MVQQNRQYSGGMEDDNKNCATGRYKGTFDSILLGHCTYCKSWVLGSEWRFRSVSTTGSRYCYGTNTGKCWIHEDSWVGGGHLRHMLAVRSTAQCCGSPFMFGICLPWRWRWPCSRGQWSCRCCCSPHSPPGHRSAFMTGATYLDTDPSPSHIIVYTVYI